MSGSLSAVVRNPLTRAATIIGLVACWPAAALCQKTITAYPRALRGAYLQSGTPESVVIRWRTAQRMGSVIRYGPAQDRLTFTAVTPGKTQDHVVLLSALTPATKYFYSVGTSNGVLQSGPENHFTTSPAPGSVAPMRIWVLGDPGTGSAIQKAVRDAYHRFSVARATDLILTLGDNAYPSGTDAQYQRGFFEMYRNELKQSVLWPALGNHDARNADSATESGIYYEIFTLSRRGQAGGTPSGTQAYYSFDYGNAHFICLDSQSPDLDNSGPMLSWVATDLGANRQPWTICYWHHPPYSKGSHDSDNGKKTKDDNHMMQMRQLIVPILEAAGVDLVLCGHSHLYERSFLIHGHYGASNALHPDMVVDAGDGRIGGSGPYRKVKRGSKPAQGTVYVTAGSAGHATKPKDLHGLNHPVMAVSINVPGSFILEIAGLTLNGTFVDDHAQVRDTFTILKEP